MRGATRRSTRLAGRVRTPGAVGLATGPVSWTHNPGLPCPGGSVHAEQSHPGFVMCRAGWSHTGAGGRRVVCTRDGLLRAPAFTRLRTRACTLVLVVKSTRDSIRERIKMRVGAGPFEGCGLQGEEVSPRVHVCLLARARAPHHHQGKSCALAPVYARRKPRCQKGRKVKRLVTVVEPRAAPEVSQLDRHATGRTRIVSRAPARRVRHP
jgi:hypothetical protein